MNPDFADFVACVLPSLGPVLASDASRERLQRQALTLAPIYWAGFELRLDDDGQVDLHQGIRLEGDELGRLHHHLQAHTDSNSRAVLRLTAALSLPSWAALIDYLVLEFDVDACGGQRAPGVFFAFHEHLPAAARCAAALELLQHAGLGPELQQRVRQCFDACSTAESISHVAFMLGRSLDRVRVNFRNVGPARLPQLLQTLAYERPLAGLAGVLHDWLRRVDRVNICLDIGAATASNLGLECTLHKAPADEPRFGWLLEALQDQHLCRPDKAQALLNWPGLLTPHKLADTWPARLLLEALTRPERHCGVIEKNIAHIKLGFNAEGALRAKAYLGFRHVWRNHADQSVPAPPFPRAAIAERPQPAQLDRSMTRAIDFLLQSRHQSGWWQDYPAATIGISDEWVTAYVAYVLSGMERPQAAAAAHSACRLLLENARPEGGWGWNGQIAADADSTTWAILLARQLGVSHAGVGHALDFVRQHQAASGGVATYREDYFRAFHGGGKGVGDSLPHWCASHACVTAAAAGIAELKDAALGYLRQEQGQDGRWPSYWWQDNSFGTALAVMAMAASAAPDDRPCMDAAAASSLRICGDTLAGLSPFAAACHLLILVYSGHAHADGEAGRLLRHLLQIQHADGSWPSSATLLPILVQVNKLEPDLNRNHTTATVLLALHGLLTRLR